MRNQWTTALFLAWGLVLFPLGLDRRAEADRPSYKTVNCPVCEQKFTHHGIGSYTVTGRSDADLCWHSAALNIRAHTIISCARCGYTRTTRSFTEAPTDEIKRRIRAEIEPSLGTAPPHFNSPFGFDRDWRSLPDEYRRAQLILEWESAPASELVEHLRDAAWALRGESRQLFWDWSAEGPAKLVLESAKQEVEAIDSDSRTTSGVELAEVLLARTESSSEEQRTLELLVAAGLFAFRGESGRALQCLEQVPTLPESKDEGTREYRAELPQLIEAERALLEEHRMLTKLWLRDEPEPGRDAAAHAYLAGETSRKLGDREAALRWYGVALGNEMSPVWLVDRIAVAHVRAGGGEISEATLEAARNARLQRTLDALEDPQLTHRALEDLRTSRGKAVVAGLARALESPHGSVRANAALLLRSQSDCPDEVVARLARMVIEDPAPGAAWHSALTVTHFGRPLSLPAVVEAIALEKYDAPKGYPDLNTIDALVEYLGFLGNEDHIETIWKHRQHALGDTWDALARLANRPTPRFKAVEELRAWFQKHRPGNRESWAVAGFREVGVDLPQLGTPERIPTLLQLLEHEDAWVRCNAVRLLRIETGKNFPWRPIATDHSWTQAVEERRAAVQMWRTWAESRATESKTPGPHPPEDG